MPPRRKEGGVDATGADDAKENAAAEGFDDGSGSPLDGSDSAAKPGGGSKKKAKQKGGSGAAGGAAGMLPTPSSASSSAGADAPPSYKRRNSTKGGKIHKTPLARDTERKLEAFLIREHRLTLASAAVSSMGCGFCMCMSAKVGLDDQST